MLKITMCLTRRPDLTREQFNSHWIERHAPLVRAQQDVLKIRRYVQTEASDDAQAQEALRASRDAVAVKFDGCAELWWDDMEAHLSPRKTPEGLAALQLLVEDERRFIDFSRTNLWYGSERTIIGSL